MTFSGYPPPAGGESRYFFSSTEGVNAAWTWRFSESMGRCASFQRTGSIGSW